MLTVNQLGAGPRKRKFKKNLKKALARCPHKRGVCIRLLTRSPKKPNSAKRRVARVRLSTKRVIYASIPGEGHNLNPFSVVLVRGGNARDLPGVRYKLVRGVKDLSPVYGRSKARSKYGVKRAS